MYVLENPPGKTRAMNDGPETPGDRFLMWIDLVGGYRVCLGNEVTLGQPGAPETVDIPIFGDLSNRHARIRRDGECYLIEAIRPVRIDGRPVQGVSMLEGDCLIEMGGSVRLRFRSPHPLSATATLEFVSHHQTQPSVDAVVLMAEACVLGPQKNSHVVCPDWAGEVVLYRQSGRIYCRADGPLEIDGVTHPGRGPLAPNSRVVGPWFSLSVEAI